MSEYISFDGASDIDVSITIDAPLKDVLALLSVIQLAYDINLGDDEVDFLNLYEIIFQQVVGYGSDIKENDDV
jgi:hypothetical protein